MMRLLRTDLSFHYVIPLQLIYPLHKIRLNNANVIRAMS